MNTRKKIIKAWAYMADDEKNGKYFIRDYADRAEIYLKKPPIGLNPFVLGLRNWKPTAIEITLITKKK